MCPIPNITAEIISGTDKSITPLNKNRVVGIIDNQSIFTVLRPFLNTIQPNIYSTSNTPFIVRYTIKA